MLKRNHEYWRQFPDINFSGMIGNLIAFFTLPDLGIIVQNLFVITPYFELDSGFSSVNSTKQSSKVKFCFFGKGSINGNNGS